MPFTFSHPAAAAPLLRPLGRYGSLSALCVGGIAPDLAFIVALDLSREQTHGVAALLLFSLPAGALAYLLFHSLLKAPLIALLPDAMAGRFGEGPQMREPWSAVLVSLLCGAVTHLAWDAFTHPGTPVVSALPLLRTELASVGGYRVYAFKVLQHASSVLGLGLLAFWSYRWLRRAPSVPATRNRSLSPGLRLRALAALAGAPLLVGAYAGWQRSPAIANMLDLQGFAAGFIFAALPTAALLLTIFSVLWRIRQALGIAEK